MTEVLGPLPTTSLAEGLRRTVGFYQGVTKLAT
jgi:hypothetical protein